MKKLIICMLTLLMLGCASTGTMQPLQHELRLTVVSDQPTDIFVEDEEDIDITKDYQQPKYPYLEPTELMKLSKNKAFIKIFSGLSVSDVTRLWQDFLFLEYMTDIRDIEMFINSPGGDAFAGLALADLIIAAKNKGFTIIAHGNGIIASAAVPVFASCNYRIAARGTFFMVHEASLWKWPGQETASDIRSQNEMMILLQNKYLSYLVDASNTTLDEWIAMERKTTWFSAEKALELGLVDKLQ